MNQSIQMIYKHYPNVERRVEDPSSVVDMSNVDLIFYQLALFVNDPKKSLMNLSDVYNNLSGHDLELYLEILNDFFTSESKKRYSFKGIEFEPDNYLKTRSFYDRLVKEIPNTTINKNYFWNRIGNKRLIPEPDMVIDGQMYWHENTVKQFIEEEKKTKNRKK